MKKYFYLLIVAIFTVSVLFFGVSCKATAETTAVAETTATAETTAAETKVVAGEELFISIISHTNVENPYLTIVGNGVKQAGIDLGVKVEHVGPDEMDPVKQMALIDGAIAKGANGIGIMISDVSAMTPKAKEVVAKGIPVNLHMGGDTVWDKVGALCFIGGVNYDCGYYFAKHLVEAYGCKNIAIDNLQPGEITMQERTRGFKAAAEELGVKWTEIITDVTSSEKTAAAYKAAFLKDPTIDGISGGWCGSGGLVIVPTLEELGLSGKVTVGIADFTPEYLKLIKDGKVQFSTNLQPFCIGYYSVASLVSFIRYGISPTGIVSTGPTAVDKNNVDAIIKYTASGSM